MKKTILTLSVVTAFLFTSCTTADKPPVYSSLANRYPADRTVGTETDSIDSSAADTSATDTSAADAENLRKENNEAVSAILMKYKDCVFGSRISGSQLAVECDGNIFINYMDICILNRRTGSLQGLCTDPLCSHVSCIESLRITSMISDGDRLYFKGVDDERKVSFTASYDPETDKFEYLDKFDKESGNLSYAMTLHGGQLYYTKRISDDTNSLFRIPTDGGNAEQLTFEDEFVQRFSVTDDRIYYVTQAYTLKSMAPNGSDVQTLDEYICMVYADGDDLFKISAKDENGYAVTRSGVMLPDRVYSPVSTVLADSSLWYTIPNKQNLSTSADKDGKKHNVITYNGTALYQWDMSTEERTEYDCSFACGISDFYGMIGPYMIVSAADPDKLIRLWMVNSEDTSEYYRLYEY